MALITSNSAPFRRYDLLDRLHARERRWGRPCTCAPRRAAAPAARSLPRCPRCAAPLPPLPRCLPFPRSFVDTVASHCCCILAACGDRVRTRAYWRGHYSLLSAFPLCYVPRLGSYLWSTPPLGGPLEGCADKGVTARALAAGGSAIQNEDAAVASFKLRSAGLHGL